MEEEVKEKYMEFQMLKGQMEQLIGYVEQVTEKIAELTTTKQALDELSEVSSGTEAFVPLSQGIFVKAKLGNTSELLVAVGGETAVAKSVDQVKKIIDTQILDAQETHLKLQENIQKIHGRIPELMKELQDVQES